MTNNLIFGRGVWYPLDENVTSKFASVHNNVVLGTPSRYLRRDSTPPISAATVAAMEAALCADGVPAGGNGASSAAPDTLLVSPGGLDGNVDTLADDDWRPLPSATAIIDAGTDQQVCGPAMGACPAAGTAPCGDVTKDLDGAPRTVPYSAGAFEVD